MKKRTFAECVEALCKSQAWCMAFAKQVEMEKLVNYFWENGQKKRNF